MTCSAAMKLLLLLLMLAVNTQQFAIVNYYANQLYNLISTPVVKLAEYMPKENCTRLEPNALECCTGLKLPASNEISHCTTVNNRTKVAEHFLVFNGNVVFRKRLQDDQSCLYVRLISSTICITTSDVKITYTPPIFFNACFGFSFMVHSLEYYEQLPTRCHRYSQPSPINTAVYPKVEQRNCLETNTCG